MPSSLITVTGATPITNPLPAGQSATDSFSFPSFAPFEVSGQVDASNVLSGSGVGTTLTGGVSFTADVTDPTGLPGTIELVIQQSLTTPMANSFGVFTGTSFLQGTMNAAAVADGASVTGNVQTGGYFLGNFDQGAALSFNDTGSGLIPSYAADGYFYEQVFLNFGADANGSDEEITLPLGGSLTVPDPMMATTPEPASIILLVSGLVGAAGMKLRKRR